VGKPPNCSSFEPYNIPVTCISSPCGLLPE
jgi:hypothetical protein